MKHIIGQAVWQCIVLFFFLFAGEFVIPESVRMYQFDRPTGYIYPGRAEDLNGKPLYTREMISHYGASRHLTWIFTTFVLM